MGKPEKNTQEKQLAMMRIQTLLLVCILVLLVISAVFLFGQFSRLTATVSQLDLDQVNRLVEELSDVANQLSAMDGAALNETVRSLQKAADNLTAVDMNSLNEAVNALSGAANTLKKLDIAGLNDLVASLETVAARLDATTGAIGKIFGR